MLSVWLPLNGDVKNQGLMDISPQAVGSGTWENGKIGKCYNGTGNGYINLNASITMNGAFSIALWIKVNSFNGAWARIFGFYKNVDEYLGMCYSNTNTIGFHIYDSVNGTKTGLYDAYRYTPVVGEWSHITLVFDGVKTMRWYKDGNLLHTDTNVKSFAGDTYTQCAICSIGNGNNKADCCVNDFRIYDHALSPREAAELAKGLVLHYPLSRPGNKNILAGNYSCITTATSHTTSGVATTQGINNLFVANQGKKLWFSFDYSTEGERQAGSGSLGNRYGAHLSFRYTKTDGTLSSQMYPCTNYLTMSGTGRAEMSYTLPTDIQSVNNFSISLQPNARPASGNTSTWYLKNFKLEIGERATPWVPNEVDSEYSAMGFDDGIEYDVSGYGNNGTIRNPDLIDWDSDTPRYNASLKFRRSATTNAVSTIGYITANNFYMPDEFTIAYWRYYDPDLKLISNPSSDFGYGTPTGYSANGMHHYDNVVIGNFAEFGSDTKSVGKNNQAHPSEKVWQHRCIVFDGNQVLNYNNGVLSSTVTVNATTKMHLVRASQTLTVGYDQAGGIVRGVSGNMSDFRIYATALSADDILELYHTPISLSNNGTLLTQGEYEEV